MSSRGASRYGRDATGLWQRDADGLPVYEWDLKHLPEGCPAWAHLLGTGLIQATADPYGVLRLIGGPATDRIALTAPAPGCISALRVDLYSGDRILRLLPFAAPAAWHPQVRYGCGYVAYGLSLRDDGLPLRLDVGIEVMACSGKPYVLAEISVRPGEGEVESWPCVLTVAADISPGGGHEPAGSALFAREGAAIMGMGEGRDDAFLAGSSGWESHAVAGRLELRRSLALRPREAVSMRLLLGTSAACSLQWLRQQFDDLTAEAVHARHRAALQALPVNAPELWIREELLWCRSALAACQARDALTHRVILHPGPDLGPVRTAHLLALCPFVQRLFPDVVRDTLLAVAARQGPAGQLPETLRAALPPPRPDPARERSDTEVAFLLAWAGWLSEPDRHSLLGQRFPEGAPPVPTLAERLELAAVRVHDAIGCGPHGLVRLLAGDWNGALDRAGRAGAGESVLTTAQFAAALRGLAVVLRQADCRSAAERFDTWQREAAAAVGDAFRNGAFLRGYSDTGEAFGDPASGPVFAEVQAWAVLARCGTVTQRREALDRVLGAGAGAPITSLTAPYPSSWPSALCHAAILPGEGHNAGIGLLEAAWFLQALALEGRGVEALARFQELTLRRRAAGDARPPLPAILWAARVNGPAAQARAWWPETSPAVDALPPAFAVAWEEEVLRALLTPGPA